LPNRILIVEDEQLVAADLEVKLNRLGYEVVGIASSGEEAIGLASQHLPDLVLLDIRLQGDMDGIETARHLTSAGKVKFLFVSAFAQLPEASGGLPSNLFLTKPYSLAQLQIALFNILDARA
jgi:CheY-like chemotaxis protein